jgi:FKBP-type peptidyl-prolyl cis-trans isomerase
MSEQPKSEIEKTSYALGMNIAESLIQLPVELDSATLAGAVVDILTGKNPKLSQEDYTATMQAFQAKIQEAGQKAAQTAAAANNKEQIEFIEKNKDAEGVVVTASGLQYKVISEGDGAKPTVNDTVRVHYTGTLLNGTEFDSSVRRGQPAEFGVGQVIPGWTEALQLMNVGSKYQLFIPSDLAYGDRGAGQLIGPGAMLAFEVELLDIL